MSIQTRQKADVLAFSDSVLAAAASFRSDPSSVDGYAEVAVFAVADQPFQVRLYESADPEGIQNYVQTAVLTAQASSGRWFLCERVTPCGLFIEASLANQGGAMELLKLQVLGIPLP